MSSKRIFKYSYILRFPSLFIFHNLLGENAEIICMTLYYFIMTNVFIIMVGKNKSLLLVLTFLMNIYAPRKS